MKEVVGDSLQGCQLELSSSFFNLKRGTRKLEEKKNRNR